MVIIVIDNFQWKASVSCKPQQLEVRIGVSDDKHNIFIGFSRKALCTYKYHIS